MLDMAKKTNKPPPEPEPLEPLGVLTRFPDRRLVAALDRWAERRHLSRNMALVVLVEAAMKKEGLWPVGGGE